MSPGLLANKYLSARLYIKSQSSSQVFFRFIALADNSVLFRLVEVLVKQKSAEIKKIKKMLKIE
jgi:hypothetical protein